jgi:GNAT superfamily N-acetyltransferase
MTMDIRRVRNEDLAELLHLYAQLNEHDAPLPNDNELRAKWMDFLSDPKVICLVAAEEHALIASCTLVVIPNLTRGTRPYGLIENVVTRADRRNQGVGTRILQEALRQAWGCGCYKVMLLTSRKEESTLRFYERAGFKRGIKTGFVAHPE